MSSRGENRLLSSLNPQYSFQGHIAVSCFNSQTPPKGTFPPRNKTDIHAGAVEIWVTTTELLKATIILVRASPSSISPISASVWRFPRCRKEKPVAQRIRRAFEFEIQSNGNMLPCLTVLLSMQQGIDSFLMSHQKVTVAAAWPAVRREWQEQNWNFYFTPIYTEVQHAGSTGPKKNHLP